MKKRISYYVAALVGKAMIHGMHLMKRNATNLPGEVALQLCPSLLANFQMPKHVIVVTGTNGKTTVTNLIGNVLTSLPMLSAEMSIRGLPPCCWRTPS